ncbi:helix-turn-helix transcriptional regulator [Skermania piniformis]|uniref:YafY family transcriptional regulator n=1 Tax=Skermania pinensis TaxID=39122 RepID=A0ABX8SFY6_9ACTN|nr:YafY family protein [Skermania piniformis]QXQ15530.1 YafY family transcriptional regulator [Skermania piniformis]
MAVSKVERLMNLVIALLSTHQYLPAERIRRSVAGYADSVSTEAFYRMFERDKNELRDLGVPLETGTNRGSSVEGYRINRDAYELPEIDLNSAEAAAVAVAVQMWESPELAAVAQSAVQKLRAAGVQVDPGDAPAVTAMPARTRGSEPALGKLLAAIDAGRAVRFRHRGAANEPFKERRVEPWGVVTRQGRWYLVGHDLDRDDTRTFRLSRIADDVAAYGPAGRVRKPERVNLRAIVDRVTGTRPTDARPATVWVADDRAHELRRMGTVRESRRIGGRDGTVLQVPAGYEDWLVRLVAGYGPDAVVLDPPELRTEVVRRLRAVARS